MSELRSAKIRKWMSVTIAILSLSVFAMSISSYTIDKDGIIVPYTTVMLLASFASFILGIGWTVEGISNVKSLEGSNDDSYRKVN